MGAPQAALSDRRQSKRDQTGDPCPEGFGAPDPRPSGPRTVHTQLERLRLPTPSPVAKARPLHAQAPRGDSERPRPRKRQPQRSLGADTHLAEPRQRLGPPSQTTAATGSGASQRASPRGIPSRPIPQVPLSARSLQPPSAPSLPNPAGAPGLAGTRAPGDEHALATDATQPLSELAPDIALATADVGKKRVPGEKMELLSGRYEPHSSTPPTHCPRPFLLPGPPTAGVGGPDWRKRSAQKEEERETPEGELRSRSNAQPRPLRSPF